MKYKLACGLTLTLLALSASACSSKDNGLSAYNKGVDYLEDGNYSEAVSSFEQALEKDANNSEYLIDYGTALIKEGKYEEAADAYGKAIKDGTKKTIKEENKKALRGKGIAYYLAEDEESAISCFEEALALDVLDDLDQDINEYLGKCYLVTKQYDRASETYDVLLKEDKKNYSYYINKATAKRESGDESAANDILNEAISLKEKSDEDKYQEALCHYYLGEEDKAIDVLNGIKDSYSDAFVLEGDIYYNRKEYENAQACYEAYLEKEKDSDTSEVSYKLSNCYIKEKNYKKAIVVIEEALGGQNIKQKQKLMYNQILCYEYDSDFNQAYLLAKEYVKEYPADEDMAREFVFLKTRYNG